MTADQMKSSRLLAQMSIAALEKNLRNGQREIKRYRRGSLGYNHFHEVINVIKEELNSRGFAA